jgi:hypothetical protein
MSVPGPADPANALSRSTAAMSDRVEGLWSRRWPVTQAANPESARLSGSTFRTPQHSPWPSS